MKKHRRLAIQIIAILSVFVLAFLLAGVSRDSSLIREFVFEYGYEAIFVVSLISGFNIIIPVPASSFVPLFIESGLSLWITIAVMTIGLTIADILGFLIGRIGRELTASWNKPSRVKKLEKLCEKNYWVPVIFLFAFASFVPIPNEVVLIPLAFIGYRIRNFLLPIFLGNAVFLTWTSLGIVGVFNFFS